jgi:hypothetical protein
LSLFGAHIRPNHDAPTLFCRALGPKASRLLEAMRTPVEGRPGVPKILTDALETEVALAEVADALPDDLLHELAAGSDRQLLLLPTGPLWGIPWAAMPVDGQPLVHHTTIRLAPSTALITPATAFDRPLPQLPRVTGVIDTALAYANGSNTGDELLSLVNDQRTFPQLDERSHGDVDFILCHGQPRPGLAHHVEHGVDRYSAAEVLTGPEVARVVVLLACWSAACQYDRAVEPVALPTIALVRGADAVIGSQWALPFDALARMGVELLRHPRLVSDPPGALRDVQLAARERDPDPSTWSTLACYG